MKTLLFKILLKQMILRIKNRAIKYKDLTL
jgi:hypothetical protein